MTRAIPTGRRIADAEPGSPKWMTLMTGSKIAAVLGLSPWQSKFNLWHLMAGNIAPEPMTDEQERGHRLEDAVRGWWADKHPTAKVRRTGTFVHRHRSWQAATPDWLCFWPDSDVEAGEGKTDASDGDEWGEEETDEIPPYYRCQVIWAMDVLGLRRARFGVLTSRLMFRRYIVDYDEHDAELMRTAGRDFMHTLELGEPPDIDESTSTYRAVRQLHPDIEDVEVEVPQHIADRFRAAVMLDRLDERRRQLETSRVAQEMGTAHFAKDPKGVRFAARVAKGDSPPYIQLAGPKKQWERSLIAS